MAFSKKRKFTEVPEVTDEPHQPKDFKFPKRSFGNASQTTRTFQSKWFNDHSWIHYDENSDSAFCHVCIQAYKRGCLSSNTAEPRFISDGYTNWKDATRPGRGFSGHENSECHKEAVQRTVVLPGCTKDIGELLSSIHAAEKATARHIFLKILSNIRFLARQALPLRGDGHGEPNSNFNQLYLLRADDDPSLLEWIKKKGDKYTSHDMQNEILKVCLFNYFSQKFAWNSKNNFN